MRIDCRVAGRHIMVNYCEHSPASGVRIREGEIHPPYFDFYFTSFQEFHRLIYYILELGTHEGFFNEKK